MNRIFIAAQIDPGTQNKLHAILSKRKNDQRLFRLTPPENLHITLKFIGEATQTQIESLRSIVKEAGHAFMPPAMQFSGGGVFPAVSRARILWIGLDPGNGLNSLVEAIETGCEAIGFPREKKPFHPHVTLGRITRPVRQEDQQTIREWIDALNQVGDIPFQMKYITVYNSDLSQKSPVYRNLFTQQCNL